MRRRQFIVLVGAAAVWPWLATAQQPTAPVIGFMSGRSPDDSKHLLAAFRQGLGEAGFAEGQNVTIEYRWALGQQARLPALAADLVNRPVTIIAALGGDASATAAKLATSTIPIVFGIGADPVEAGLVDSVGRPGRNATGYTLLTRGLEPKRLGLLRDLLPNAAMIAVLYNPTSRPAAAQLEAFSQSAMTRNLALAWHLFSSSASAHYFWRGTRISTRGVTASSCLRHKTNCPPSFSFANMPLLAVS